MRWLVVVLTAVAKRRTAALVAGGVALLLGVVMLSASTVTCGDETMYEGDICAANGEDSTVRLTYDEQKRADQRGGRVAVAAGIAGLLLGGVGYTITAVDRLRTRRTRRTRT